MRAAPGHIRDLLTMQSKLARAIFDHRFSAENPGSSYPIKMRRQEVPV
jgi:hypothetical protein